MINRGMKDNHYSREVNRVGTKLNAMGYGVWK
jgi:hypothetical protein